MAEPSWDDDAADITATLKATKLHNAYDDLIADLDTAAQASPVDDQPVAARSWREKAPPLGHLRSPSVKSRSPNASPRSPSGNMTSHFAGEPRQGHNASLSLASPHVHDSDNFESRLDRSSSGKAYEREALNIRRREQAGHHNPYADPESPRSSREQLHRDDSTVRRSPYFDSRSEPPQSSGHENTIRVHKSNDTGPPESPPSIGISGLSPASAPPVSPSAPSDDSSHYDGPNSGGLRKAGIVNAQGESVALPPPRKRSAQGFGNTAPPAPSGSPSLGVKGPQPPPMSSRSASTRGEKEQSDDAVTKIVPPADQRERQASYDSQMPPQARDRNPSVDSQGSVPYYPQRDRVPSFDQGSSQSSLSSSSHGFPQLPYRPHSGNAPPLPAGFINQPPPQFRPGQFGANAAPPPPHLFGPPPPSGSQPWHPVPPPTFFARPHQRSPFAAPPPLLGVTPTIIPGPGGIMAPPPPFGYVPPPNLQAGPFRPGPPPDWMAPTATDRLASNSEEGIHEGARDRGTSHGLTSAAGSHASIEILSENEVERKEDVCQPSPSESTHSNIDYGQRSAGPPSPVPSQSSSLGPSDSGPSHLRGSSSGHPAMMWGPPPPFAPGPPPGMMLTAPSPHGMIPTLARGAPPPPPMLGIPPHMPMMATLGRPPPVMQMIPGAPPPGVGGFGPPAHLIARPFGNMAPRPPPGWGPGLPPSSDINTAPTSGAVSDTGSHIAADAPPANIGEWSLSPALRSIIAEHGGSLEAFRAEVKSSPDQHLLLKFVKFLMAAGDEAIDSSPDPKKARRIQDLLYGEALKWLKKLTTASGGRQPIPEGLFLFAECYGSGWLALPVDHEKAFYYYTQASKVNHPAATFRMAVCLELGVGVKRDPIRALTSYRKAADLGDVGSMYKIGMILLRGLLGQQRNLREAMAWLHKAAAQAESGMADALFELAQLYEGKGLEDGDSHVIQVDPMYARDLYLKAAQFGVSGSQHRLGLCYEYGQLGLPVDPRRSIAWYSKAAEQADPEGELALSGWYLTGVDGVLKQSDTEAYLWARKAADKGLAKAEYAVGYYTEQGVGVRADSDEARRWFLRAAAQGNARAIAKLKELKSRQNIQTQQPAKKGIWQ